MKIKKLRFIYNAISFKVFLMIIIILAPLIAFIILNNFKTRDSLMEQVKVTHTNMLQSYLTQIDGQLENSMGYALDMALFQTDPLILAGETDESSIAFAKNRIYQSLSNRLITNNLVDAFFLYVKSKDYFIIASKYSVSSAELEEINKYVVSNSKNITSPNTPLKSTWTFTKLAAENSLINTSFRNADIIVGAYANTDRLLNDFRHTELANLQLEFIPTDTLNTEIYNTSKTTLFISAKSSVANISLIEALPKTEIFKIMPFLQRYIFLASIFWIFIIPLFVLLMNFTVIHPLQKLTKSMLRVHNGDLTYRIKPYSSSNEFEIVNTTFNEMMDEVQNLKINVYEQQIKVQRSQLRNLQLQIKPHFLINSLNMVNNLILNQNYSSATDLILHSVDYFRYMTKADEDYVHLNEELKHVTTYLEIQKIRYKDKFTYSVKANQLIEDMLIPPLLIQSFVENSIKYAIEMSKVLHLSINVEYFEVDYYPYAKIVISDTGVGYPDNLLEQLNAGKKITDSLGDHIGIQNSVHRIKILFEGKASWKFYNNGGAVSELVLPALFDKEEF
jgi:two-component system sensor histidine kinase YesM